MPIYNGLFPARTPDIAQAEDAGVDAGIDIRAETGIREVLYAEFELCGVREAAEHPNPGAEGKGEVQGRSIEEGNVARGSGETSGDPDQRLHVGAGKEVALKAERAEAGNPGPAPTIVIRIVLVVRLAGDGAGLAPGLRRRTEDWLVGDDSVVAGDGGTGLVGIAVGEDAEVVVFAGTDRVALGRQGPNFRRPRDLPDVVEREAVVKREADGEEFAVLRDAEKEVRGVRRVFGEDRPAVLERKVAQGSFRLRAEGKSEKRSNKDQHAH
ncbi:MAG TPA: hypothetical protein VME18_01395 [Acidobacteriaceae bacterium]|nr:hypothetical protein [Acidobacteriaceae bacterium]